MLKKKLRPDTIRKKTKFRASFHVKSLLELTKGCWSNLKSMIPLLRRVTTLETTVERERSKLEKRTKTSLERETQKTRRVFSQRRV